MRFLVSLLMTAAATAPSDRPAVEVFLPAVPGRNLVGAFQRARMVVTEAYAEIGVQVVWRSAASAPPVCSQDPLHRKIVVSLVDGVPPGLDGETAGFAKPYAQKGACVTLVMDQVRLTAERNPLSAGFLLGNVLAHEMGHVLEGVARHSETGMMKDRWSREEVMGMTFDRLHFSEFDRRLILQSFASPPGAPDNWEKPAEIQPNDNRQPAGQLSSGILTLRLEVGEGVWNPEGDNGPEIPVQAFGEEGQPLMNPGPLIRVPAGTRVRISTRNRLLTPVTIHGLHAHTGVSPGPVTVRPGEARTVEFRATLPGAYFYWGTTTGASLETRDGVDSQLSGAFIVDPPAAGAVTDRVFVLGHWLQEGDPKANPPTPDRQSWVINGKSWPHTERLTLPAGTPVRWQWINPTDKYHPLHLHGHYFLVEGTGDEERWETLLPSARRRAVTEALAPGSSVVLSWTPERRGNWLFHCHTLFHVAPELRQTADPIGTHHEEHDASSHMAGLVLGITVTQGTPAAAPAVVDVRPLRLIVGRREGVSLHDLPGLGYRIEEVGTVETTGRAGFTAPGPPIVLTRGQPVAIAVENQLGQSTSVHWHGMELESYYDGVPGWGGDGQQITPPIRPGETFVARFTPPRAGTFIYHTHLNDYIQLSTGLYGPLIVVEPGRCFDPESDKVFLLSQGPDNDHDRFLINGSASPAPIDLRAGKRYRFRIIGIAPALRVEIALDRDGHTETWRAVAKDGAELPPSQAVRSPARLAILPGETYDFEFQPASAGRLRLTAVQQTMKLLTEAPIVVHPPDGH